MQTFTTDIWTPGLEANSLTRKSGGSVSRRPSTASSSKGGSPKMEKKAHGSGSGFGPSMSSMFSSFSSDRHSVSSGSGKAHDNAGHINGSTSSLNGSNGSISSPKSLRSSKSNLASTAQQHLQPPTGGNGGGSSSGYSSGGGGGASSDGGAGAAGKKHGILYRIFHPHDHEGSGVLGRSRRSYHSGSESEMDSEDEYASDIASDMEGHGQNGNGNHHGLVMTFPRSAKSLSRNKKSSEPLDGQGNERSGGPRLMSMSGGKKSKATDADSASESESESFGGGIFRRDGNGKSKGTSIFNKVLNSTISRKSSSSASNSRGNSPAGSDGNISASSVDSESDSDAEHQAHPVANKLFKNIMTSRKDSHASTHSTASAKTTVDSKKPLQTVSPTAASPSVSASPSRKSSTAVPPSVNGSTSDHSSNSENFMKPPLPTLSVHHLDSPTVLPVGLTVPAISSATSQLPRSASETSLAEKYGKREEVLGKGAYAVVRLCCPLNSDKKYAIKEFRKRRKDETQKEYVKKLVAEFCISSTLDHPNVVKTVDLIQDEKKKWCVVMEYCAGGDLFTRIHSGTLTETDEINCYFKQLVLGVQYLHSMGVAHRDLKPENLLLDVTGRTIKITDFGVSEVFRTPFGKNCTKGHGVCGSGPYIAPEEYVNKEYDSELVDVWAMGIIYYVMLYNSIPWKAATISDARFKHYVEHHGAYWPLDRLPPGSRAAMYRILEPNPTKRITMSQLFENEWFKSIEVCLGKSPDEVHHKHIRTPTDKH